MVCCHNSDVSKLLEFFSTAIELWFDYARGMFPPCSRYVPIKLEVCFDRAFVIVRPCSWYVSAMLDLPFDHSRV